MGLRASLFKMLNRGSAEADPDEVIEIANVPLPSGPMTVASLCREGFDAVGVEAFSVTSKTLNRYSIMVPRRQAADATAKLDEFR